MASLTLNGILPAVTLLPALASGDRKWNLSEYSKLFDKEDEYARLKLSKGQIELQRRLMEELNAWRGRVKKICQRKGKMLVFLQKVPSFDNIAKFEFKEHR
ncbi:eukaryotic translation initiation factor 3 subunit B [Gigaspora margarita]|uniref:Eukaryotic translation initiation factor 3 subunit B n=1 Tax=Gigaspora margarita TaxID=4874 RepID=A0A8H4A833_GIGMA|nr:eukaryotic translation initiation factor 3 subunit B [Gigaspora margarita]